jgi:hypothetical protein
VTVTRVELRQAPNHRSLPSRHLRTPQTGLSEVVCRGRRGGRGQTLKRRASTLAQGTRARRAQVPALGFRLIRRPAPMEVGGPSDEMLRVSTERLTNVRTCCCGSGLMLNQN